jgi:hypothetical protein
MSEAMTKSHTECLLVLWSRFLVHLIWSANIPEPRLPIGLVDQYISHIRSPQLEFQPSACLPKSILKLLNGAAGPSYDGGGSSSRPLPVRVSL